MNTYSLFEVNQTIKTVLHEAFPENIWITAEINDLKVNRNGHCYLELIEKDTDGTKLLAKARATIWANIFREIKPFFEQTTGQLLIEGIKVRLNISVEFHELYGFSFNIKGIDPSFTLGDLERQKKEIIGKLEEEGLIDKNKELEIPLCPQKIAVISSPTAAGYQDFSEQLTNNGFGYTYYTKIFPAIMQGNEAEESLIQALDKVAKHKDFFDLVVIIRGGGSQSDLNCFNNYNLASKIANFELPVLTGIGHERDETILDIVAHTKLKTPTAVAEFLIDQLYEFESSLIESSRDITDVATRFVNSNQDKLLRLAHQLSYSTSKKINQASSNLNLTKHKLESTFEKILLTEKNKIADIEKTLPGKIQVSIEKEKLKLEKHSKALSILNPSETLKRGYSITSIENKVVNSAKELLKEDKITTTFYDGESVSKVEDIKLNKS
jgi:exodeoxyribonuclease VII large subunit